MKIENWKSHKVLERYLSILAILFFLHTAKNAIAGNYIQPTQNSPVQEFHLFSEIRKSNNTETVTVAYKDYQGAPQKGTVEIPKEIYDQTNNLFKELVQADFRIQRVKPLSAYKNVYEAMKDNATFFFETEIGRIWLIINPVNNPLIVRDAGDQRNQKMHNEHHYVQQSTTQKTPSNVLAIFPAAAALSVNVNQTNAIGKLTPKALPIFRKYSFDQVLQPDNNPYELCFGLLGYKYKQVKAAGQEHMEKPPAINVATPVFTYGPLPDSVKKSLIDHGQWTSGCPVPLQRLAYVQFGYYGYDGNVAQGALVTADVVAPEVLTIFKQFFQQKVPIEQTGGAKIGGTGMFICRKITGAAGFSLHSYGTALDLSYYHNPYVGEYKINASGGDSAMVATGAIIPPYSQLIFLARNRHVEGFNEDHLSFINSQGLSEWGGHWLNRTDYMHFQTSPFFSYVFPTIDYNSGRTLFALEKSQDKILHKFSLESTEMAKWAFLAQLYPKTFANAFAANIEQFNTLGEDGFYRLLYTKLQIEKKP